MCPGVGWPPSVGLGSEATPRASLQRELRYNLNRARGLNIVPQIQCQINAADRVVILSVSGDIGDQDLASLGGELEKDPEVQPDFSLLIDLRHAKDGSVTSAGVRALARLPLVFSPASRVPSLCRANWVSGWRGCTGSCVRGGVAPCKSFAISTKPSVGPQRVFDSEASCRTFGDRKIARHT
jgi:hypothetical protein